MEAKKTIIVVATILSMSAAIVIANENPFDEIVATGGNINLGNTLYVGGSGPNNYTKIQDAINDAKDGDTVFVYDDSSPYYENIKVDKSINLVGENKNTTIIDGKYRGDVIKIHADNVKINNFTIRHGRDWTSINAGILVNSSYNTIYNCNICSNKWDGIRFYFSNNNIVSHCNIHSNYWHAIALYYSNNNTISYCTIDYNYYGIECHNSDDGVISHCYFSNENYGLQLIFSKNATISDNTFIEDGILIAPSYYPIENNEEYYIHTIENNSVDGKQLLYLFNESDRELDGVNAGEIIVVNCNNFTIKNMNMENTDVALEILNSKQITIVDCIITNNIDGIFLADADNNSFSHCNISYNGRGIDICSSKNNSISRCNLYANSDGLRLRGWSNNNIISNCNISQNDLGIFLLASQNLIINNEINHNKEGIYSDWAWGNLIENNHIFSNGEGIHTHGRGNEVRDNIFMNNGVGIDLSESEKNNIYNNSFFRDGISITGKSSFDQNSIFNNTINGKLLLYLEDESDVTVEKAGQVILVNCHDITIKNQEISNTCVGIQLCNCDNCFIYENNISNNGVGIWLHNSLSNLIRYNNFINNHRYVHLFFWRDGHFFSNRWNRNYWDNWPGLIPRPILGLSMQRGLIIDVDWCPLLFPYKWWLDG